MLKDFEKIKYLISIVLSAFFLNWYNRLCMLCYKSTMCKQNMCFFKYSLIGAVIVTAIEWMKIKSTFICSFKLQHYRSICEKKNYQCNTARVFSQSHLELNYQCNTARVFSQSHLELNANENVRCIQEKKWKVIIQTDCKFKIIWLERVNKSVINLFIDSPFLKWSPYKLTPPIFHT